MRFLLVAFAIVSLSACGPKQASHVDTPTAATAELAVDEGAVMLEVIHGIGTDGSQLDRWSRVKVVSMIPPADGEQASVYTLDRVVTLGSDSAIFAGVLPSGFYRLATFEGEWQRYDAMQPYVSAIPEKPGEFFVSAGKLNALGVMLHSSIADWTWVFQREPHFDMPALVRELRPELVGLNAPLLIPEALLEKTSEPNSQIDRAWPTTPLVYTDEGRAMRGAQFGRIYVRETDEAAATWSTISLDSLQSVVSLVPVSREEAYALDASGRVFRFNPVNGNHEHVGLPVPARITGLGHAGGNLYAVNEKPRRDGSLRLQLYRRDAGDWQTVGTSLEAPQSPHAIVFTDSHLLFTTGGTPYPGKRMLTRVLLADGTHTTRSTTVQLMRHVGGQTLVGALLPARSPRHFRISRDGGLNWGPFGEVDVVGWPALDAGGNLVTPMLRTVNGVRSLHIGSHNSKSPGVRFPARCLHFTEAGFIGDKLFMFCGERVFQHDGNGYGWRKEALHELQSSLP